MEKIKTTITIDKKLWQKFTIKVIQKFGGRKGNEVIESMIKEFVEEN